MQRTEAEIDQLLAIGCEAGSGLGSSRVTGVGSGGGESVLEAARTRRGAIGRVKRLARESAIAEHIQASVPGGGQVDFHVDLRRHKYAHAAMLGSVRGSAHHGRANDGEFETGKASQLAARDLGLGVCGGRVPIAELDAAGALAPKRGREKQAGKKRSHPDLLGRDSTVMGWILPVKLKTTSRPRF